MTKSKVLYSIIGLLVLLNVGLIFFVLTNNHRPGPPPNGHAGPKQIIIQKLHFSEEQADAYLQLIEKHSADIRAVEENLNQTKATLYKGLATGEAANETLLNEISVEQAKIENLHYQHFLDIRKLCTEEQLEYFKALSEELNNIFVPVHMPSNP